MWSGGQAGGGLQAPPYITEHCPASRRAGFEPAEGLRSGGQTGGGLQARPTSLNIVLYLVGWVFNPPLSRLADHLGYIEIGKVPGCGDHQRRVRAPAGAADADHPLSLLDQAGLHGADHDLDRHLGALSE